MRDIKVSSGAVTAALASLFAASCLVTTGYAFLHVPAPPSAAVTAAYDGSGARASIDRNLQAMDEASMKSNMMSYSIQMIARQERKQKAAAALAVRARQQQQARQAQWQAPPATPPAAAAPVAAGIYGFAALEHIWEANGGSPARAAVAACIAEHESGGNPRAISPTDDFGLWQIHADPAALNPAVSAATAVRMSSDGTDWSQWTTHSMCGV